MDSFKVLITKNGRVYSESSWKYSEDRLIDIEELFDIVYDIIDVHFRKWDLEDKLENLEVQE